MARTKSRKGFYTLLYMMCLAFALIGLIFNIRTVPLVDESQKLLLKIHHLDEMNQSLRLALLVHTRPDAIEWSAAHTLHMVPEDHVTYVLLKH